MRPQVRALAALALLTSGCCSTCCDDKKKDDEKKPPVETPSSKPPNTPLETRGPFCRCTGLVVRTEADGTALGPAGDGTKPWPDTAYDHTADGKKLGPLAKNPGASGIAKKDVIGYSFEVSCTVEGDAHLCDEIQLVRSTQVKAKNGMAAWTKAACEAEGGTYDPAKGTCALPKKWKGKNANAKKMGIPEIDVADEAKCLAAKGTWDATAKQCTLAYPKAGVAYGPDAADEAAEGGAYERPFDYKVHLPQQIIWFDTPYMARNVLNKNADFIAAVRGTDGKYCYAKFTMSLEQRKKPTDPDIETLTVTDTGKDVDKIPGL